MNDRQWISRKNRCGALMGAMAWFPQGVLKLTQFVIDKLVVDCRTQPGKPSGHVRRTSFTERLMNNCGSLALVA